MASLADLVLDADDLDELALEDEDLIRELEELNALRAARNPESAAASATCTPSARLSTPGKTAASLGKAAGLGNTAKASLADRIADGVDDVDREFQAMEKELQQQLLKYKEQCKAEPVVTVVASVPDASGKEQLAAVPAEAAEEAGNDIATPELLHLRTEAAKMEENFPEVREVSQAAEQKPRDRRVRRVVNSYDGAREEVVESKEMTDMKQMLASLDVRMTAIQQKHSLHDGSDYKPASTLPAAATRAIAELQAQNSHLRDRFSASDKRGLLQIDPSVFGADEKEKPLKGMSASPQADTAGYGGQ